MKRILAYGDSNTWGYIPGTLDTTTMYCERFSSSVRWTGVLQKKLGEDYVIIEEGLPGRTIAMDDSAMPGMNGIEYLRPCLLSHRPLDLVIIMLGTNDLKIQYQLTAEIVKDQLSHMCHLIKSSHIGRKSATPSILIVAPPHINSSQLNKEMLPYYAGKDELSKNLSISFSDLARASGYYYFDANQILSSPLSDGLHLDEATHLKLATKLEPYVINALSNKEM